MKRDYDYLFKLVLIGDSGVGKSCLLLRFADDTYTESYISTIGVDFKIRTIERDGKTIKLQIWDTAGQERYRALAPMYYRGASGALVVYDITSEDSFRKAQSWIKELRQNGDPNILITLVGNKCDLEPLRAVPQEEGQRVAQDEGLEFVETSAKDGLNVDSMMSALAVRILDSGIAAQRQQGRAEPPGARRTKKEEKSCCS
eukprot:GILI01006609.1.p1 GENE.GILI01006609.1~~GILI01006609.1.p1  ORF type:complete len:201 (-),score=42.50 GILI01006609.1:376-978(-)